MLPCILDVLEQFTGLNGTLVQDDCWADWLTLSFPDGVSVPQWRQMMYRPQVLVLAASSDSLSNEQRNGVEIVKKFDHDYNLVAVVIYSRRRQHYFVNYRDTEGNWYCHDDLYHKDLPDWGTTILIKSATDEWIAGESTLHGLTESPQQVLLVYASPFVIPLPLLQRRPLVHCDVQNTLKAAAQANSSKVIPWLLVQTQEAESGLEPSLTRTVQRKLKRYFSEFALQDGWFSGHNETNAPIEPPPKKRCLSLSCLVY